jgi:hypothetical protein
MATAPKSLRGSGSPQQKQDETQLRSDRLVGLFTLLIIAALMLLMIWVASLGGGAPVEGIPLMP